MSFLGSQIAKIGRSMSTSARQTAVPDLPKRSPSKPSPPVENPGPKKSDELHEAICRLLDGIQWRLNRFGPKDPSK